MKEFFSKFTFGFLMAQLVPGGVAVLFVSMLVVAYKWPPEEHSLLALYQATLFHWSFTGAQRIVVFVLLSTGAGMVIHGVNWMVLAWLENRTHPPTPVYYSFWHGWRPIWQLLVGPIKMLGEVAWLLIKAPGIDRLRMDENVTEIKAEDEPLFAFIQDFYLHFAQFYAHTAYALLIGIVCLTWSVFVVRAPLEAALVLPPLYFLTSILFLIGRVQYGSLCGAEVELKQRGSDSSSAERSVSFSVRWR